MAVSCSGTQGVETLSPLNTLSPTETNTSVAIIDTPLAYTPTSLPTFTNTPKIFSLTPSKTPTPRPSLTPTKTPFPTTEAQATIETFGVPCRTLGSEISPDGNWIAFECYESNSHLRVMSLDRSKDWSIIFANYVRGGSYSNKDIMIPYRWSEDGRFLYAVSPSRFSGCCWIGQYWLLVRLSLETGDQVDILNVVDTRDEIGIPAINFAISEDDRYVIYEPPISDDDLVILDLLTWETQELTLEFQNAIDANYVLLSPGLDKIVMALFRYDEEIYDYRVDAIGIIDLITDEQKKIISNLTPESPLYPVRWEDPDHILLSTFPYYGGRYDIPPENKFWLLNIQTAELTKVENP